MIESGCVGDVDEVVVSIDVIEGFDFNDDVVNGEEVKHLPTVAAS
jgi:hypothetical protein